MTAACKSSACHFFFSARAYFLGLAFLYLFFLNPHMDLREFNSHDPVSYLRRAEAIWNGIGHGEVFENGFFKTTIQMPGFPLILAPLVGILGFNFIALKLFMVFGAGLLCFGSLKYFRYFLEKENAIFAMFFLMTSPVVFGLSHTILADMPVLIPIVLGLVFLNKYVDKNRSLFSRSLWASALCIICGYFLKPTAIGILAGGWFLFLHPKYRTRLVFMKLLLCTAIVGIPVWIWKEWCQTVPSYWYWSKPASDFFMRVGGNVDGEFATFSDFLVRIRHNIVWGISANISTAILPLLYFFRSHVYAFLISIPINLLIMVMWGRFCVKKPTVLEGFLLFQIALLVIKPQGMAIRYSVVFYPILIVYLFSLISSFKKPIALRAAIISLLILSSASSVVAGVIQLRNPYGVNIIHDYIAIAEKARELMPTSTTCRAPMLSHWQILTGHSCYIRLDAVPDTHNWGDGPDYYVILSESVPEAVPPSADFKEDLFKTGLKLKLELEALNRPYKSIAHNRSFDVVKLEK